MLLEHHIFCTYKDTTPIYEKLCMYKYVVSSNQILTNPLNQWIDALQRLKKRLMAASVEQRALPLLFIPFAFRARSMHDG